VVIQGAGDDDEIALRSEANGFVVTTFEEDLHSEDLCAASEFLPDVSVA